MNRRDAVVQLGAVAGSVLLNMDVAKGQAAKGKTKLAEAVNAKYEPVPLAVPAKKTGLNIRMVVTIEGEGAPTKVLDSLFNQDGRLIEVSTSDAHLRKVVASRLSVAGDIDTCYNRCRHHLDEGNAPAYAVCFYACLAEP
jgi:hypothetical protein